MIADAAMLSNDNLDAPDRQEYPFIVAARIRNDSQAMRETILRRGTGLQNGQNVEIEHDAGRRLIVVYSDKRARKDAHNRKRGLQRLRKQIQGGRLTKESLNRRGYNKFLRLTGKVTVEIDELKIEQAARWDGLKGYLTNTDLSAADVIENYGRLWRIGRAFRISKTDLRIRPMYHRRRRRIEAHVLVAFVAYTIYKELERRLAAAGLPISPSRAAELTQTMYELTYRLPNDPDDRRKLLTMDPEQKKLYDLLR
ncbi:MAG TPA: transposase [Phycisphaerae bacterium]|nr:transposase [Phycisphaerae bacterium]